MSTVLRSLLAWCCVVAAASSGSPSARAQAVRPAAAAQALQLRNRAAVRVQAEDMQAAAMRAQLQPLVKVELSFANRVCQWTDEERAAAIGAANKWLDEFARDHSRDGALRNRLMIVGGNAGAVIGQQQVDVEQELAAALVKTMTDEQRSAYDAERESRRAFRKEASIANLVSLVDQRLNLTPEQRQKFSDSLREKWDNNWAPSLEMFIHLPDYLPTFPDELLVPHLTEQQRSLLRGVQKIAVRGIIFGGGAFGNPVEPIDDIDLQAGD